MSIEFEYALLVEGVDEKKLEMKKYLMYQIEGVLTIYKGSQVLFEDPHMNLLELAAHLYKWLYVDDASSDFVFISIDHDDPILVFAHSEDERWCVDSIWRQGEALQVERQELLSAVSIFLKKLDGDLGKQYGVRIASFVECLSHSG